MAIPARTKPAIDPINSLNIGLMIISCLAAYALPFELFLFSYAVLGPLHYMTQICWLHDRAYFTRDTRGRKWWLALVGAAMLVVELGVERRSLLRQHRFDAAPHLRGLSVLRVVVSAPQIALHDRPQWRQWDVS